MKGKCRSFEFWVFVAVVALCLPSGVASAQEEPTWPMQTNLVVNFDDSVEVWADVGDITIWNTHGELKINVVPAGYKIVKAAFHVVTDPAEFTAILDKKGKPDIGLMEYVTEYKNAVSSHLQVIDMQTLDVCWSVDPAKCPPNRNVLVAVELKGVEARAYADGAGSFDRDHPLEEPVNWGHYATYPLAKVEPGHFVDANVAGLTYRTVTQEGITGEEGQFWFLPDERVSFQVGNLYLGEALADRAVSPMDLLQAGIDDDRVLNMARLLQSLDGDGNPGAGSINITEAVRSCVNTALATFLMPPDLFSDDAAVESLINAVHSGCDVVLVAVTKEEAAENLVNGTKAGNLMARNISKTPGAKSDKAQIEIMGVYTTAKRSDGTVTEVVYYDADGEVLDRRSKAKPIVVSYVDEVEGTGGAKDVFIAISLDDGDTWKRRNISKTADKTSRYGKPGDSWKPMLEVQDNNIFVAWSDKYCNGGRPAYAITRCPADDPGCTICRDTELGVVCAPDYPGDDAYWQDDLYGVGGPQRSVVYEEYPELGEVPYSCVWTARGVLNEASGEVQWYKPERITSGRRDAFQITAFSHPEVGFAIVWQEDPKGLMPGEGDGPGDGWSGANTHNKADIWLSSIRNSDFTAIDYAYPSGGFGDSDLVDLDPELSNRAKALIPMSIPVKISDNDICSLENMLAQGGGEHPDDEEGEGTHRYCGEPDKIGTAAEPGENPLCAYTIPLYNPNGELHNVCVTADARVLDGNTGASRANLNLQPYTRPDGTKSAWAIVAYEESKGVGVPPEQDDADGCGDSESTAGVPEEDDHDTRYKPDIGKNIIYHSFDLFDPQTVSGGGIVNLPETDAAGNVLYVKNEDGSLFLDPLDRPVLAYENARRVRFLPQPKKKASESSGKTTVVILYRQGPEGSGKPADIFMRRAKLSSLPNPYDFKNIQPGAYNLTSVTPTVTFQDPFDATRPVKMLRWNWTPDNLLDSSSKNDFSDARAHRGALNGDDLLIAYSWTPNWGRRANDKYDFYVHRSFDGGRSFTTDPAGVPIEHYVTWRVPVIDEAAQEVLWEEEVLTTAYMPGETEPPRNVSNLRNNRMSVLEPRLIKAPGTILTDGITLYPEDKQNSNIFQLAWGVEFNVNSLPDDLVLPKTPLDIYYGRTVDKGQRYESVVVTPQNGGGRPQEGFNLIAKDQPQQGAAQVRQTPDGSRMYAIWLEESDKGSDIMFRRVDYRE